MRMCGEQSRSYREGAYRHTKRFKMTSFYVSDDIITCACSHMCVLAYSTVWCHIPPTQTNAIFTAQKNAYHLSLTISTAIFKLEISVYSYFFKKYLPDRVKKYEQKKRDSCFLNVTS